MKMDPNDAIVSSGNTCLHIAVEKRVRWMLSNFLLPHGGDVNKKNKEGISPLDLARRIDSRSIYLTMEWQLKVEESIEAVRREIKKVFSFHRWFKMQGKFVFFDLETDKLFQEFSSHKEALNHLLMTVGVLFDGRDYITYFGNKESDIEALGKKFDESEKIIIFNHSSDIGILEKYFVKFPDRVKCWREKVIDPYLIILELDGSQCSLSEIASVNRLGEKGESKEAPTMWKEGRIQELISHCRQVLLRLLKLTLNRMLSFF